MSASPRISIVTPTFSGRVTLRETIESVLSQDYTNWEHIVIDGGSTNGTLDILRKYPHLQWVSEKDQGHYMIPPPHQSLQLTAGRRDDQLYFHEPVVNIAKVRCCQR